MILPDVNLLVYAYSSAAPHHPQARQWWEGAVNGVQPIGLPWVVALGFVRILTSRAVMAEPMEAGTALGHVHSWLEEPSVFLLQPGPRHLSLLRGFAQAGVMAPALVTDAHIAALALEHQGCVHSNDADFARFPGLRWVNPLQGPEAMEG